MMWSVYVIRHKPTGKFMPCRMFRTMNSGWSHWEPTETRPGYKPHDENPRIFFTLQSARNALTMWLAGAWVKGQTQGNYFEPPEETGPEPRRPEQPRQREDMEIIPLTLSGLL